MGAVQYFDAQVDDARHTMTIVRTAAAYGALAVNRARVVGFLREGERVVGVRVRDLEHGEELEVAGAAGHQRDGGVDRRDPGHGR